MKNILVLISMGISITSSKTRACKTKGMIPNQQNGALPLALIFTNFEDLELVQNKISGLFHKITSLKHI